MNNCIVFFPYETEEVQPIRESKSLNMILDVHIKNKNKTYSFYRPKMNFQTNYACVFFIVKKKCL